MTRFLASHGLYLLCSSRSLLPKSRILTNPEHLSCFSLLLFVLTTPDTTADQTTPEATMPGRRVLQNWDAGTHEAVLLALIEHMRPTGSDWSAVVNSLRGKGYTFTEGALM